MVRDFHWDLLKAIKKFPRLIFQNRNTLSDNQNHILLTFYIAISEAKVFMEFFLYKVNSSYDFFILFSARKILFQFFFSHSYKIKIFIE